MADLKISQLTPYVAEDVGTSDVLAIVDLGAGETKKISMAELDKRWRSLPTGGTIAQVLTKISNANGDVEWITLSKSSVGLDQLNNTSDLNKPISTATQAALNQKAALSSVNSKAEKGYVDDQLALKQDKLPLGDDGEFLSLDENGNPVWVPLSTGDATLTEKGVVQLAGDLAGTAAAPTVPALAFKAPLNSPEFTGEPTAPTRPAGDDTDGIATTAFVKEAVDNANIPDATTTVKGKIKLAGDLAGTADAPTVPALAGKAPIESPEFTGTPTAPTPLATDNSERLATTEYVQENLNVINNDNITTKISYVTDSIVEGISNNLTATGADAVVDIITPITILKNASLVSIAGLLGEQYPGEVLTIINRTGVTVTLKNNMNVGELAEPHSILLGGQATVELPHEQGLLFKYDPFAARYIIIGGAGAAAAVTPGTIETNVFSGTGAQTAFTLTVEPLSIDFIMVYLHGVYQQKSEYTLVGTTLTFTTAPLAGTSNVEVKILSFGSNPMSVSKSYVTSEINSAKTELNTAIGLKQNDLGVGTEGQVLTTVGGVKAWATPAAAPASVGSILRVTAYTGNATWAKQSDVKSVLVKVIGGGGGGGGGFGSTGVGGAGGTSKFGPATGFLFAEGGAGGSSGSGDPGNTGLGGGGEGTFTVQGGAGTGGAAYVGTASGGPGGNSALGAGGGGRFGQTGRAGTAGGGGGGGGVPSGGGTTGGGGGAGGYAEIVIKATDMSANVAVVVGAGGAAGGNGGAGGGGMVIIYEYA